jgi:hypothetical protein
VRSDWELARSRNIWEAQMQGKLLGALAAAAVTAFVAQAAQADEVRAQGKAPAKAAKCVHNCQGYAECKGNGNNSCKGKNDCSNTGLVPKACSSQTTETACKKVLDAKKNGMCSWYEG